MYHKTKETERKLLHRLNRRSGVLTLLVLSNYYRRYQPHRRLPLLEGAVHCGWLNHDARVWFHYGEALEWEDAAQTPPGSRHASLPCSWSAYRKATELDPNHAEAWFAQGRILKSRFPLAPTVEMTVEAFRRAVAANPNNVAYRCWLGSMLAYGPCRPEEGAQVYEDALRLSDQGAQSDHWWFTLAEIYFRKLGHHQDAKRCIDMAISVHPNHHVYRQLEEEINRALDEVA